MSLIEGVGDEVTLSLAIFVVLLIFLIWTSRSWQRHSVLSDGETLSSRPLVQELSNGSPPVSSGMPEAPPVEASEESVSPRTDGFVNENTCSGDSGAQEEACSSSHLVDGDVNAKDAIRQHRLKFFEQGNGSAVTESSKASRSAAVEAHEEQSEHLADTSVLSDGAARVPPENASNVITLRLKYLNDTVRLVESCLDERVAEFKRRHFEEELSANKIVRLIYNGQLLHDESTLRQYGLDHDSVVHVQISQIQFRGRGAAEDSDNGLDLSRYMWSIFAIMLGILWALYFQYEEYFNTTSTLVLIAITGLYLLAMYGQNPQRSTPATPGPEAPRTENPSG